MRIFYLVCFMCMTWTELLYANVTFPSFRYNGNSVAVIKADIHETNLDNPFKYITTGLFFKKGDVKDHNNLMATDLKAEFPLQIKPHNYYNDGSLRFAIATLYINKNEKNHDIHIVKAQSKYSTMPDIIFQQPLNIQVHVTTSQGAKHIFDLRKAKPEKKAWNAGALLYQKRFHTDLFQGMTLDFDVTQFHTGQYHTDIVFHYDLIQKTPMHDIQYRADIYVNGKLFKKIDNRVQHHHTRWRYPLHFGYKQNNSSVIDMRRIMAVGALPHFDLSLGTDLGKIEQDYQNTNVKYKSIYGSGLLNYSMPTTGGRDDIGILPQWAARYVVSGHDMARHVVLKHAEIASHIPWNYYDSASHRPANVLDHPKVWIEERATLAENNIAPFKQTSQWEIDTAHQPSLTYLPFIISGDRYHYDTMKAIYMTNRFRQPPKWPEQSTKYRSQAYEQIRSYGWFRRTAGEMQSILDVKNDPDADYINKANHSDLDFLYKKLFLYQNFSGKQNENIMGELTGALEGYGNHHDTGKNSNFMQDLAALGIGFETALGIQPWLKQFSYWQSQFIAGRFLQKHNGYPPQLGSVYTFLQFIEDKSGVATVTDSHIKILNRWRDVYNYSLKKGEFNEALQEISEEGITGYPRSASGFTAYARASNAQLFNVTRNPDNLEAFGFLAQFIHLAMDGYRIEPSYRITPIFDDGVPLSYNNIVIGSGGNNTLDDIAPFSLVHAGQGDDVLAFDRPLSKGFLFGGDGNDILGAADGAGSYLFGGDGNDRLIASSGNDIMKGDENHGKGKDIFIFTSHNIGNNMIQDFDPQNDMIQFCSAPFDIQGVLRTTKEGVTLMDVSKQNGYSGSIILKNIRKNQINGKNVQFKDCAY